MVVRRTKADACESDGSPLFARRVVHTEAFTLSDKERDFYDSLLEYLRDGYNLAAKQGSTGRALGFIMTIFQKIAASSFAAIRTTLQRRMLALTIQEAIERDELLDVDGRNKVLDQARQLIHEMYSLPFEPVGKAQADQILADAKVQMLKKQAEVQEFVKSSDRFSDAESIAAMGEESAAMLAVAALPEERTRIRELLGKFPLGTETKSQVLTKALRQIWDQNSNEKVVVFATYLGSVDAIKKSLDDVFPGKGVDVLKGGDHGAKTAAQKRFRRKDGPNVLVCTAAGREGINLQFARILFNYDLPWNPMDLEQRIGRIHRYGQQSTAQVYNLVAKDTIEGQIFLLLEEKLHEIAQALGKVDEKGQIAEDLRGQVLGQLGSQLSYDRLYQDALADPTLKRTRQELEVALSNADTARQVVFELFQDIDRFNIGDYKKHDDQGRGMQRLISFMTRAEKLANHEFRKKDDTLWEIGSDSQPATLFTSDRDRALQDEKLELLGLEHPIVRDRLRAFLGLNDVSRSLIGKMDNIPGGGLLTVWKIVTNSAGGKTSQHIVRIAITSSGERAPWLERLGDRLMAMTPTAIENISTLNTSLLQSKDKIQELLHRELVYSGIIAEGTDYSATVLGVFAIEK